MPYYCIRKVNNMNEKVEYKIFSRNLAELLRKRNLTQAAFAEIIGVNQSTVSHYLNAHKIPQMKTLDRICQIFHCSRSDLLEERAEATDPDERALVADYRLLAPDEKEGVRNLAAGLASKYKKSAAAG